MTKNTSWSFEIDHVHMYAFYNNAFTKEECDIITNIGKNIGLKKAGVIKGEDTFKIRNNDISWIYPTDNTKWIFEKIQKIIVNLNKDYFKFDLYGINEGLQFTNYKAPSDKYGKHIDRSTNTVIRKLSASILLTNPNDYEGGELCLYDSDNATIMKKEQGTLILFPSFTVHEVMPITKGERNSLVAWVTGPAFK